MEEGFKMPDLPLALALQKPKEAEEFTKGQGSVADPSSEILSPATKDDTETDPGNEDKKDQLTKPKSMLPPMNPKASTKSKDVTESLLPLIDQKSKDQRIAEKQAKYAEILASLKYKPPPTGAPLADPRYGFEVLKTGTIVENIRFKKEDRKGFYVVGRVPACDVVAENPTVSRTHAILQFIQCPGGKTSKSGSADGDDEAGEPKQTGLYVFDLNSTHGTFINKNQVFPNKYYRLHVGHVLKFGNSARLYVLLGPSEDEEVESEKSVTELQNEKLQKELERKRLVEQGLLVNPGGEAGGEDGCSWGMGDDADEESDLRENPFAINFEESESFDNPKKTLRGWFEREDYELIYDCREKAPGQFICRINLPLDGPAGTPVFAEVDVKGKKREAVHQAALQACQILDKYGVLRQSHVESKANKGKRKKVWEDQDYYSSDEDTFLDRTGSVEKKREKKMKIAGKVEEKAETYESLSEKAAAIQKDIITLQSQISKAQSMNADGEEIDVDDYVKYLKTGASDVKKLKSKLREANEELKGINKLLNIVKPAALPLDLTGEKKSFIKHEIESIKSEAGHRDSKSEYGESPSISIPSSSPTTTKKAETTTVTPVSRQPKLFGPRLPFNKPVPSPAETANPEEVKVNLDISKAEATTSISLESRKTEKPIDEPKDISDSKDVVVENNTDSEEDDVDDQDESATTAEPKQKKKRNRQRQKFNKDVKYDYDVTDPKYSTWVPPKDQHGDGRTSLNEKLGY